MSVASSRWSDVFRRSRMAPCLFTAHEEFEYTVIKVVEDVGLPGVAEHQELFSGRATAWPLLDGAVAHNSTYGLPRMRKATRVIGNRPLRLLCHLMDLDPPARRLSHEDSVPPVGDLLRDLATQLESDAESLQQQAAKALFHDREGANWTVRSLLGNSVMPVGSEQDQHDLPGVSEWGENGFTRGDAVALSAVGLTASEARRLADQVIEHTWIAEPIARGTSEEEARDFFERVAKGKDWAEPTVEQIIDAFRASAR